MRVTRARPADRSRPLLHAACLLPHRVGLAAARAFTSVVRKGKRWEELRPADFAAVGECLRQRTVERRLSVAHWRVAAASVSARNA